MAKVLMIQGTMSNAGKSLLTAGLCRIFRQDGYRVAPFKSQNMALNSYVTKEGLEMGRAQVVQAEAAGTEPVAAMNPILLKPTDNEGSQVIVNGRPVGNMKARDYFEYKKMLIPVIREAFRSLSAQYDIIVVEGAGSPAEINLKQADIVNMGLAEMLDAPVLLVGDIDCGGVFAQLIGTLVLLEEQERARVKGLVINKFRGDASLLDPGIEQLEAMSGIPVVGVVPYMEIRVEDEDSLSARLRNRMRGTIDLAVIRLPKLSNFSDFDVFEQFPEVSVRYVREPRELGTPDLILLPGSKSTIADLRWLREQGLEGAILAAHQGGSPVFGICGGYQMLGESVSDPTGAEGGGEIRGLGLLPVRTVLAAEKQTRQFEGTFGEVSGLFAGLSGKRMTGYEIHMGQTTGTVQGCEPVFTSGGTGMAAGEVYGSYVHGIFDRAEISETVVQALAERKGLRLGEQEVLDHRAFKEQEYDRLAETLRRSLDMDRIYEMLKEAAF
ncbi:MAG: cobyric acid synthase [Mogibacterium sp.]|nr:cobyric acid synthase [Mogibacterium sp.]